MRKLLGLHRPLNVRNLISAYNEPIILEEPLVTAAALGGHQKIVLFKDGRWEWTGHFNATGFPSFEVSLTTQIVAEGGAVFVLSERGSVHGTVESGSRRHIWSQRGHAPIQIRLWRNLRRATLYHDLQYDADFFGTVGDVISFIAKGVAAGSLGGSTGLWIALSTEIVDALDWESISLPSLAGLVVAGGTMLVMGPYGGVPAIVAGLAAGVAIQDALETREFRDDEYEYFDRIFGGKLPDKSRIILTNLLGLGGRAFVWPGPGNAIYVNVGEGARDPVHYEGIGGKAVTRVINGRTVPLNSPGQLLVHELTHAWQIEHSDIIPIWMCEGLYEQLGTIGGSMKAYHYDDNTDKAWSEFNLEQQASIVEDWYAGNLLPNSIVIDDRGNTLSKQGKYLAQSERSVGDLCLEAHVNCANPFYRYIRDNIRAGVA